MKESVDIGQISFPTRSCQLDVSLQFLPNPTKRMQLTKGSRKFPFGSPPPFNTKQTTVIVHPLNHLVLLLSSLAQWIDLTLAVDQLEDADGCGFSLVCVRDTMNSSSQT